MACEKVLSFCSCRIRHLCYPLESSPYLPPAQAPLFLTCVVSALMLAHSPSSLWSCLSPHPSLPYAEFLLPGKDLAVLSIPFHLIKFLIPARSVSAVHFFQNDSQILQVQIQDSRSFTVTKNIGVQ